MKGRDSFFCPPFFCLPCSCESTTIWTKGAIDPCDAERQRRAVWRQPTECVSSAACLGILDRTIQYPSDRTPREMRHRRPADLGGLTPLRSPDHRQRCGGGWHRVFFGFEPHAKAPRNEWDVCFAHSFLAPWREVFLRNRAATAGHHTSRRG